MIANFPLHMGSPQLRQLVLNRMTQTISEFLRKIFWVRLKGCLNLEAASSGCHQQDEEQWRACSHEVLKYCSFFQHLVTVFRSMPVDFSTFSLKSLNPYNLLAFTNPVAKSSSAFSRVVQTPPLPHTVYISCTQFLYCKRLWTVTLCATQKPQINPWSSVFHAEDSCSEYFTLIFKYLTPSALQTIIFPQQRANQFPQAGSVSAKPWTTWQMDAIFFLHSEWKWTACLLKELLKVTLVEWELIIHREHTWDFFHILSLFLARHPVQLYIKTWSLRLALCMRIQISLQC